VKQKDLKRLFKEETDLVLNKYHGKLKKETFDKLSSLLLKTSTYNFFYMVALKFHLRMVEEGSKHENIS